MYPNIPLSVAILFAILGFWALAKGADVFVDGARDIATRFGVPPFIVGMAVIGFGTSAPELVVSAMSGYAGHSDLSLGNAYGSDVFNILVIIGVAAMIRPISVPRQVALVAAPALAVIAVFSCLLVGLGSGFSRLDGLLSLGVFAVLFPLYCRFGRTSGDDSGEKPGKSAPASAWRAAVRLAAGLVMLVGGAHILVWGSVDLARAAGVSELLIGLTVIAAGTSLPELAAAVASARKGEDQFVLGNIVGSNFFNTLAVVGIAGAMSPFRNVSRYVLARDLPVLVAVSLLLGVCGINWRNRREPGRIGRIAGLLWLLTFVAYLAMMLVQEGAF